MKYRIKATNEIIELRTWRRDDGAIKLVDKYGKMGFWPDEVEPAEHLGWHPASELPPEDGKYIVISLPDMYGDTDVFYAEYRQLYGWCYEIEGHYAKISIQKWCYPPEED